MKNIFISKLGRSISRSLAKKIKPRQPKAPISRHTPWAVMYGSQLEIVPEHGAVLNADGKPTRLALKRVFSHQPGEVVKSRSGASYMVRTDQSLRKI